MCGVFFYTKNQKIISPKLSWSRGPDGKKFIETNETVLGHRLLAVRDKPEKSIQPVTSIDKRYY